MAAEMSSMVGDFMSNWQSKFFRERIVSQIANARETHPPDPQAEDHMEKFLAENSCEQLEEFIFQRSDQREDYLSLVADMLMQFRQCKGVPGQGRENLNGAGVVENGATTSDEPAESQQTTEEGDKS